MLFLSGINSMVLHHLDMHHSYSLYDKLDNIFEEKDHSVRRKHIAEKVKKQT